MTGILHTAQSLTAKLAEAGNECWTVRVRDVFGDYGLVGAIVFKQEDDSLRVDTFLLSCRALGRGVEERMVDDLKRWALERGAERVVIPVVPTARNHPAREFLGRFCELPIDMLDPFECVLSASSSSTELRPVASNSKELQPEAGRTTLSALSNDDELLIRIASELQTASAVVAAVRNQMKRRPADAGPYVAPVGSIEEALARIWSECLSIEPIGAHDNFFDFGGQSLIATRVLTRVRSDFGVEMSLTNFFEKPTLGEMAAHISGAASAGSTAGEVRVSQKT